MTKINKSEQTGRSMVEMLGVLAVIGVLSITGISGYTTAMNKHKANEILDAASKRAVAVSTQIQRGNTNPTLAEFDDNEVGGATFSDTVLNASGSPWGPTDTQFKIGFETEPSPEVLAQMQAIAGEGGIIQSLTGGLTYNNDLTVGSGSGEGTDLSVCPDGQYLNDYDVCVSENPKCDSGKFYNGSECVSCPTPGSSVQMEGNGTCGKCPGAKKAYVSVPPPDPDDYYSYSTFQAICVACAQGSTVCGTDCCESNELCQFGDDWSEVYCVPKCSSDSDCGDNKKCMSSMCLDSSDNYCTSNKDCNGGSETGDYYCSFDYSSYTTKSVGVCTKITSDQKKYKFGYYRSMIGQDAENFCKALGTQLISINSLGCSNGNGGTWSASDYIAAGGGYCCTSLQPGASITDECLNYEVDSHWWLKEFYGSARFCTNYYGRITPCTMDESVIAGCDE